MTSALSAPEQGKTFLGHPQGLAYLAFAETWERFSFYGMQTLLVLYMVSQLLTPGHVENVFGFAAFRSLLEGPFGRMSEPALASAIFGLYASAVYLTPILGGLLADQWLGRRRTVILGGVLMTIGHFLMAFEQPFLLALICMVLGAGCFKGNIASQVGALYAPGDQRRADAFQVFYLGINAGAICAPLVCGTLGETVGWHYGFAAAGVGMVVGLLVYITGRRHLPDDPPVLKRAPKDRVRLTGREVRVMALLVGMLPVFAVGLVANQQLGNAYLLWARDAVDRTVFGHTLPVTWLLTFQGVMTVLSLSVSVAFWRAWSRRRPAPTELTKIVIGMGLLCAAPLTLAIGTAFSASIGVKVSPIWVAAFATFNELGFANVLPVALALYARAAPPAFGSTIVGVYYLQLVGANLLAGWMGGWLDKIPAVQFWLLHAGMVGASAVVFVIIRQLGRSLLAPSAARADGKPMPFPPLRGSGSAH